MHISCILLVFNLYFVLMHRKVRLVLGHWNFLEVFFFSIIGLFWVEKFGPSHIFLSMIDIPVTSGILCLEWACKNSLLDMCLLSCSEL